MRDACSLVELLNEDCNNHIIQIQHGTGTNSHMHSLSKSPPFLKGVLQAIKSEWVSVVYGKDVFQYCWMTAHILPTFMNKQGITFGPYKRFSLFFSFY